MDHDSIECLDNIAKMRGESGKNGKVRKSNPIE
jgi:hypothetical protein